MICLKVLNTQIVSLFLIVGLALINVSCQPTYQKLEPILTLPLPTRQIQTLPSAFPHLTTQEKKKDWAKELLIGNVFARDCDFYRAITSYKRALILIPSEETNRRQQITYNLILCYYLGGKFQEALNLFEEGELSQASPTFPAFNNLIIMVYDSYLQTEQEEKAACTLQIIQKFSPESGHDLSLYQSLKKGEIENARCLMSQHPKGQEMEIDFAFYDQFSKSPSKARALNALLPGAGYYYVGQKRSAVTSFLINALFTAAAYQFFNRGYPAAGAITTSLELGWYLGGINGAGIAAHEFNTTLYEGVSRKILTDNHCFPLLMFETSF